MHYRIIIQTKQMLNILYYNTILSCKHMFVNPILVYIKHYMCLFKQIFRNKAFMHSILLMKYP
jgi:hypothetical protein